MPTSVSNLTIVQNSVNSFDFVNSGAALTDKLIWYLIDANKGTILEKRSPAFSSDGQDMSIVITQGVKYTVPLTALDSSSAAINGGSHQLWLMPNGGVPQLLYSGSVTLTSGGVALVTTVSSVSQASVAKSASLPAPNVDLAILPTGAYRYDNASSQYKELVETADARLSDQRVPQDNTVSTAKLMDGNVTYLKLVSTLKAWLYARGYEADSELLSRHRDLPNNYAVLDANNNYNQVVEVNRLNWDATNNFASANIHDAFMVGGSQKRVFLGKAQASDDGNGHPVSWMNRIPMNSKTFDQELAACAQLNNGTTITGYHQMTNSEFALLQLVSKNLIPNLPGNNNWGQDIDNKDVTFRLGTPAAFTDHVSDGKSYSGSGGPRTSHNGQLDGIYDLNGNVWERVAGMKIVNGEIQIINQNDAANYLLDQSATSSQYKAILDDGTLVAPGTAGTLKWSAASNITKVAGVGSPGKTFETVGVEADVLISSAGIALLKKLGIFPFTTGLNGDNLWLNLSGEFVPRRGGSWLYGSLAGLFSLYLSSARSAADSSVGFRLAFVL